VGTRSLFTYMYVVFIDKTSHVHITYISLHPSQQKKQKDRQTDRQTDIYETKIPSVSRTALARSPFYEI
jgi:hypothetical protein